MPLTWDIGEIKKYKGNLDDAYYKYVSSGKEGLRLQPLIETLIFFGGAVGIGNITEKTAAEYYGRGKAIEFYSGGFMQRWGNPEEDEDPNKMYEMPLLPVYVYDHIGLTTNHGFMSTTEWAKVQAKNLKQQFNLPQSQNLTPLKLKSRASVYCEEYEIWRADYDGI